MHIKNNDAANNVMELVGSKIGLFSCVVGLEKMTIGQLYVRLVNVTED